MKTKRGQRYINLIDIVTVCAFLGCSVGMVKVERWDLLSVFLLGSVIAFAFNKWGKHSA